MTWWGRGRVSRGLGVTLAAGVLTASWAAAPASIASAGTGSARSASTTSASAGAAGTGSAGVRLTGAAAAAWKVQPTPNAKVMGGQIQGISCSAVTACTAVGATVNASGNAVVLAERWNGTAWTRQTTPELSRTALVSSPALAGVSCPAAAFCEAVGSYTVGSTGISLAESWNGTAWKRQTFPVPAGSVSVDLEAVSCASASFCEAGGFYQGSSEGQYLTFTARWNGKTWQLQHPPQPPGGTFPPHLDAVSCPTTTFCEAAGRADGAFVMRWNGTKWALQTLPSGADADAVSCVSASFCEAVGDSAGANWNGTSWTAQTIPPPAGQSSAELAAVSCPTTTFCAATGSYDGTSGGGFTASDVWNGTSWASQPAPSPASGQYAGLTGVSCTSATACESGGSYQDGRGNAVALAEAWNGSAWRIQAGGTPQVPGANGFTAVSCVTASFCEAVGTRLDDAGNDTIALAERWNGSTWTLQQAASPAGASDGLRMNLAGVSCVSASFCEAVGASSAASGGGAEQWNGTAWTLQSVPSGALTSVSCPATDFCMASGADGDVAVWDGSTWTDQPTSPDFETLRSVSCASAEMCEAVGYGSTADDAEGWNGTTWTPQATPAPASGSSPDLYGVSCTGPQSCQAVGWYFSNANFDEMPLAEAWNGTAWVAHSPPDPSGAATATLAGVACASADFCAAVGQQSPEISTGTLAEVWNGTRWNLRSTPDPVPGNSSLTAVSCGAAGACTGVGVTSNDGEGLGGTLAESGD